MSAAELSSAEERDPWDWYVEEPWVTDALVNTLSEHAPRSFDEWADTKHTIWDPTCGRGTIVETLAGLGMSAIGTDLFRRTDSWLCSGGHDFLGDQQSMVEYSRPLSIVFNPPYSMQDGQLVRGLSQQFVEKALSLATHKVCALLPLKWQAGQQRGRFLRNYPPRFIFVFSERPSMPPGDMIAKLGAKAWKRGKVDYCWVVWDAQIETMPGDTRTIFIPTRKEAGKCLAA